MHHYYEQVGVSEFNKIFGYAHHPYNDWIFMGWKKTRRKWKNYVTKYAQVHPWEDFAECFMVYLKNKGKLNGLSKKKPVIYKKMLFVRKVLAALGRIDLLA